MIVFDEVLKQAEDTASRELDTSEYKRLHADTREAVALIYRDAYVAGFRAGMQAMTDETQRIMKANGYTGI